MTADDTTAQPRMVPWSSSGYATRTCMEARARTRLVQSQSIPGPRQDAEPEDGRDGEAVATHWPASRSCPSDGASALPSMPQAAYVAEQFVDHVVTMGRHDGPTRHAPVPSDAVVRIAMRSPVVESYAAAYCPSALGEPTTFAPAHARTVTLTKRPHIACS